MKPRTQGIGFILAFLTLPVVAAFADPEYSSSTVWDTGNGYRCAKVRSEINHGSGGRGYSYGHIWTFKELVTYDIHGNEYRVPCGISWNNSAYDLAVMFYLEKKTSNGYSYCRGVGYRYNTSTTALHKWSRDWGATESSVPCGSGTYATRTNGVVMYNGAWRPGTSYPTHFKLSPGHTLPAS